MANFTGGPEPNAHVGTGSDDVIDGGGGDDNLHDGGGGNDVVLGSAGDDTITGTNGVDLLDGGDDDDTIFSGDDNDHLIGGIGDDALTDTGSGLDSLVGGEGNDILTDSGIFSGNDTLDGGGGNDVLRSGIGSDRLTGGSGLDRFDAGPRAQNQVQTDIITDFVNGTDLIDLSSLGIADLATVQALYTSVSGDFAIRYRAVGQLQTWVLSGNAPGSLDASDFIFSADATGQTLSGSTFDDDFFGGLGDDAIFSNESNDRLWGEGGNDTLNGGSGSDTLYGGGGADSLTGGADNDLYVDPAGDMIVEGAGLGTGTDTVWSGQGFSLAANPNVEHLVLTGAGHTNGAGNARANVITGSAGNNVLNGGAEADTLAGAAGNDTYYVDHAGDVTAEVFNQGTDIVSSSVSRTLSANIENLNLSGAGNIDGNGNTGANRLNGNAGNNILRGHAGADTLNGAAGEDIILGGTSGDSLNPGSDAVRDIIRFSAVADSTGSQRDIVTGMDLTAEDVFDFTVTPAAIAVVNTGTLSLATINANLSTAVNAALAVNGAVLFDPNAGDLNVAGHLFLVVDGNADGSYTPNQDYVVQLINATGALSADDFI